MRGRWERIVKFVGLLFLASVIFPVWGEQYEEGKHYQRLPQAIIEEPVVQAFQRSAKYPVQVIEFFSYACSWCEKLDPYIEKWHAAYENKVDFQRIPVEFQPAWGPLVKAYYVAQEAGILEQIHVPLFEAIQSGEITDTSSRSLQSFFTQHGMTAESFHHFFDSFYIEKKKKWAHSLVHAYRITAVPEVIVQGPRGAFLTAVRMTGSEQALVEVIDYLVQKV